jgi:hypothetical protein
MTVLTTQIHGGRTVAAKRTVHGDIFALTYANRTQAHKAAAKIGGTVIRALGGPWYVEITL